MGNEAYSAQWFSTFLAPIPAGQTAAEIAFLQRQLPRPPYTTVLDVCCGPGRHAAPLAAAGYQVTGVDLNAAALEAARAGAPDGVRYLQGDMRQLGTLAGSFDAILILWQSFGQFDAATNTDILRQVYGKLNPQGRFVLDIYQRAFFAAHLGCRSFVRAGRPITETKTMAGPRLQVGLDYGDGTADTFEWYLYTPDEIGAVCADLGFALRVACTGFDECQPPRGDAPRMQLVFETRPGGAG